MICASDSGEEAQPIRPGTAMSLRMGSRNAKWGVANIAIFLKHRKLEKKVKFHDFPLGIFYRKKTNFLNVFWIENDGLIKLLMENNSFYHRFYGITDKQFPDSIYHSST